MTLHYCPKCGMTRRMLNCEKYQMSNNKWAIRGRCTECGSKMNKIISSKCPKGKKVCSCDADDF